MDENLKQEQSYEDFTEDYLRRYDKVNAEIQYSRTNVFSVLGQVQSTSEVVRKWWDENFEEQWALHKDTYNFENHMNNLLIHFNRFFDIWYDPSKVCFKANYRMLTIYCSDHMEQWWNRSKLKDIRYIESDMLYLLLDNALHKIDIWYSPESLNRFIMCHALKRKDNEDGAKYNALIHMTKEEIVNWHMTDRLYS